MQHVQLMESQQSAKWSTGYKNNLISYLGSILLRTRGWTWKTALVSISLHAYTASWAADSIETQGACWWVILVGVIVSIAAAIVVASCLFVGPIFLAVLFESITVFFVAISTTYVVATVIIGLGALGAGLYGTYVADGKYREDLMDNPENGCKLKNADITVANLSPSTFIGIHDITGFTAINEDANIKAPYTLTSGKLPYLSMAPANQITQTISANYPQSVGQSGCKSSCDERERLVSFEVFVRADELDTDPSEYDCSEADALLSPDCYAVAASFTMGSYEKQKDGKFQVVLSKILPFAEREKKTNSDYPKASFDVNLYQNTTEYPCNSESVPCNVLGVKFKPTSAGNLFLSRAKEQSNLVLSGKAHVMGGGHYMAQSDKKGMLVSPRGMSLANVGVGPDKGLWSRDRLAVIYMTEDGKLCLSDPTLSSPDCTPPIKWAGHTANFFRVLSNGFVDFSDTGCVNLPTLSRLPALGPIEDIKVISSQQAPGNPHFVISGPGHVPIWRGKPSKAETSEGLMPFDLRPFVNEGNITCVESHEAIYAGNGLKYGNPMYNKAHEKLWLSGDGSLCAKLPTQQQGDEFKAFCTSPTQINGPFGTAVTPESVFIDEYGKTTLLNRRDCPGTTLARFATTGNAHALKISDTGEPILVDAAGNTIWTRENGFVFSEISELKNCETLAPVLVRGDSLMSPGVLVSNSGNEKLKFENGQLVLKVNGFDDIRTRQFIGRTEDGSFIAADTLQYLSNGNLRVTNHMCPTTSFGSLTDQDARSMDTIEVAQLTLLAQGRWVVKDDEGNQITSFPPNYLKERLLPVGDKPVCKECAQAPNSCGICLGPKCAITSLLKGDKLLSETGGAHFAVSPTGDKVCSYDEHDQEGFCLNPGQVLKRSKSGRVTKINNDVIFGLNDNGPYLTRSTCPGVPIETLSKSTQEKWKNVISMSLTDEQNLTFFDIFGKNVGSINLSDADETKLEQTGNTCAQSILTKQHPTITSKSGKSTVDLKFSDEDGIKNELCINTDGLTSPICKSLYGIKLGKYDQIRIINDRLAFTNHNCPNVLLGYFVLKSTTPGDNNLHNLFLDLASFELTDTGSLKLFQADGTPLKYGPQEVNFISAIRGIPNEVGSGSIVAIRKDCPEFGETEKSNRHNFGLWW